MKLSPKAKKWGKRMLILLLIRFVVGGILYYIIVYRFKDVMQVVVKNRSEYEHAKNMICAWGYTLLSGETGKMYRTSISIIHQRVIFYRENFR